MRKNIFSIKHLSQIIYGIIALLPMFAILGRVIYTQSNPNAKDSYSSNVVKDVIEITSKDQLVDGASYNFIHADLGYQNNTSGKIGFRNISIDLADYISNVGTRTYHAFRGYPQYIMLFYLDENNTEQIVYGTSGITLANLPNFSFSSYLQYTDNLLNLTNNAITQIVYKDLKLDNAFEYSLQSFTDDNNFGEVDCFGWFTDVFLKSNNVKNNLYINFVNWYLNYTLFVSCGYIMFLVIYWFINFVRRILDKSMYQDYGGF